MPVASTVQPTYFVLEIDRLFYVACFSVLCPRKEGGTKYTLGEGYV